jgi:hypothetical protein
MPRDAFTLADVREPTIEITCAPCGAARRYDVKRLIAAHGADAKNGSCLVRRRAPSGTMFASPFLSSSPAMSRVRGPPSR